MPQLQFFRNSAANLKPVAPPDLVGQYKTAASLRDMQRKEQADVLAQQDDQKKRDLGVALHDILVATGGDIEKALPEIAKIAPELVPEYQKMLQGAATAKLGDENTRSLIDERKLTGQQNTLEALGKVNAPTVSLPGETYPSGYQSPATDAPLSLPMMDVGGIQVQPRSAQDIARETRQTADETAARTRENYVAQQQAERDYAIPPKQTLEELTAFQWLRDNPTKTLNDYQTMDANRKKPVTNIFLDLKRQQELENSSPEAASVGQIVSKSTGRPVPATQIPDARAARIEGLQTALAQADVVEKALLSLGDSGAIKGFIEENGVYWPVVQDQLSPEQAEAVSETNRMLSAYAQAVSGLAVSEPEIQRLKRSAPSVRMTPEANQRILGHFRRNAETKLNNYLGLMGWEFKKAPTADTGLESLSVDELLKRLQ